MRSSRLLPLWAAALLCALATRALAQDNETTIGDKGTELQGYTFESDVSEHARIDLDQEVMEKETDAFDWSAAGTIYAQGEHSSKSNEKRTLRGFSTSAGEKMKNEGYFRLYQNFWDNKPDYADRFVQSGLEGSGDVNGKNDFFRAEIANKGSQYQNVWMYVIHELEDAIDDCSRGDVEDNDARVKAWDEAWAFYTGTLVDGGSGGSGMLQWTLAQKRCVNFNTCKDVNKVRVADNNIKIRTLFIRGQKEVLGGQCDSAVKTKNEIVRLMIVPLMQGTIRYVYATKEIDQNDPKLQKNHAEGWAFAAAMLPLVHNCDSGVADMLIRNFHPQNEPMKDSPSSVVQSLSSVYKCLGFTCEDVGELTRDEDPMPKCEERGPDFKAIRGTENPAVQNEASVFEGYKGINPVGSRGSSGLSTGAIIGIVIGVLAVAAAILFAFFWRRSKKQKVVQPIQAESGSSGAGPGEVFG